MPTLRRSRPSSLTSLVPAALAALAPAAAPQAPEPGDDPGGGPPQPVAAPPLWYRGDTHAHVQPCGGGPDLSVEDLVLAMQPDDIRVAFAQVWGTGVDAEAFAASYAPLVTGLEHPATAGNPERFLQFGVEVSEFPAAQLGHLSATGIHDAAFPFEATFSSPVLDFFRQQPGALTGYAHVFWSTTYDPGLVPYTASTDIFGPFAPIDVALGRVDFLETLRASTSEDLGWPGLYDKLLNAGMRVAVTGGRDNTCAKSDVVTWARIEEEPLTFEKWVEAVRARRTSVSDGPHLFLDLEAGDAGIGGTFELPAPGTVAARAYLAVGPDAPPEQAAGVVRLLRDGIELERREYDLSGGGEADFLFEVPLERSGWLAATVGEPARFLDGGARTGAIWGIVDGDPVCRSFDALYFDAYAALLEAVLSYEPLPVTIDVDGALAEIAQARAVFQGYASCGGPDPPGVRRLGTSVPSSLGPVHLGVLDLPTAEDPVLDLFVLGAPPGGSGVLGVSAASVPEGVWVSGLPLFLDLDELVAVDTLSANGGGYVALDLKAPPSLLGQALTFQAVWADPAGGPASGNGPFATTDALEILFGP